jgi:hypothetical protein
MEVEMEGETEFFYVKGAHGNDLEKEELMEEDRLLQSSKDQMLE